MARAATFDRRVTVEKNFGATQAPDGEPIEDWRTVAVWSMGKLDRKADQRFAVEQVMAEVDTVFRCRWFPAARSVAPETHRFVYRGRIYTIHGAIEGDRRDYVDFPCTARGERPPQG